MSNAAEVERPPTVREWLRSNSYDAVADLIDGVMDSWAVSKVGTRRDWWHILAGGLDGRPLTANGVQFPVLRAAQIRQGMPVTQNAVCLSFDERPPDIVQNGRWPRRRRRARGTNRAAPATASSRT